MRMNEVYYRAPNGEKVSVGEFFRRIDEVVREASLEISDAQERKAFVERASRGLADVRQAHGVARYDG